MRELTLNEIEEVNGGIPVPVVIVGYLAARYAARAAAKAAEAAALVFIGWAAQEYGRYGS